MGADTGGAVGDTGGADAACTGGPAFAAFASPCPKAWAGVCGAAPAVCGPAAAAACAGSNAAGDTEGDGPLLSGLGAPPPDGPPGLPMLGTPGASHQGLRVTGQAIRPQARAGLRTPLAEQAARMELALASQLHRLAALVPPQDQALEPAPVRPAVQYAALHRLPVANRLMDPHHELAAARQAPAPNVARRHRHE